MWRYGTTSCCYLLLGRPRLPFGHPTHPTHQKVARSQPWQGLQQGESPLLSFTEVQTWYFYILLWSCTCTIAKGKMVWTDNCGVSEKVSQQLCCLHETLLWMITKNHWTGTVFDKNFSRPKPDLVTGRGKHSWLRWWGLGQWGFHFHVRSLEELGLLAATLLFFQLVWNETKYAASEILNANCLPKSKGLRWLSTESNVWFTARLHPLVDIEWRVNPAWFGQTWSFQNP